MKSVMVALCGAGICAAVAGGVWLGAARPANEAAIAPAPSSSPSGYAASSAGQSSGLWTWGHAGARAGMQGEPVEVLLANALKPSGKPLEGEDPRDRLRRLAREDSAVMKQLMASYGKEANPQARDLIVSLLSGIEKPEVLAFSRQLATSKDMAERRDGFAMLQKLSGDVPEAHSIILDGLSGDKPPEAIMMALAALRPPADEESGASRAGARATETAAIVAQLQSLARNADPNIRLQSIVQLAQWDKTDSSQEQWSQALMDQSPQVRQAAVTAVAQSGTQSDTVKTALIGVANNRNESRDVRGNALQVLERFTLSRDESAKVSQLRSQIFGS